MAEPHADRPRTSAAARVVALAGGLLFLVSLLYGAARFSTDFGARGSVTTPLDSASAALIDVLLFSAFAMHHSLFARLGLKHRVAALVTPALERSVYVWFSSALFMAVCYLWQPVSGALWHIVAPWSWLAVASQLAGVAITVISSRQLGVLVLAGIHQALGRPSSSPGQVVRRGMYGFVRHPLYFGWVLMVWPAPEMTGTRLVFALVSTLYLAVAIPFEERSLRREFGDDYEAYTRHVRWRMLPGLY